MRARSPRRRSTKSPPSTGLIVAKLKEDMKKTPVAKELADTHPLAQALNINGTPGFVIDDTGLARLPAGRLPASQIIDQVRKDGGCKLC